MIYKVYNLYFYALTAYYPECICHVDSEHYIKEVLIAKFIILTWIIQLKLNFASGFSNVDFFLYYVFFSVSCYLVLINSPLSYQTFPKTCNIKSWW